jgi:hypothetical protein
MHHIMRSAALALVLAACTPPAGDTEAPAPPQAPPATTVACNSLTPDAARQIAVSEMLATAAAADLRGGEIEPGVYDLASATRIGGATGWSGTRAVALEVTETDADGVVFNWAGADASGAVDRWTAGFTEAPQPRLTYTCGRIGEVAAAFAVQPGELRLHLQDGADGQLALMFQPRG